jgi:hypothetical protein
MEIKQINENVRVLVLPDRPLGVKCIGTNSVGTLLASLYG